jgi:hypothetical protein
VFVDPSRSDTPTRTIGVPTMNATTILASTNMAALLGSHEEIRSDLHSRGGTDMRFVTSAMAALAIVLTGPHLSAQASDPQLGTWVLNVTKSTFKPGPPPKSQTRKFEQTDRGIRYTSDGIDAEGKPTHSEYLANFDGKDYALTGSQQADTIALTRIDPWTLGVTQKRAGKIVVTGTRTISKDGRTATVKNKGTDSSGRGLDVVMVFDKQ